MVTYLDLTGAGTRESSELMWGIFGTWGWQLLVLEWREDRDDVKVWACTAGSQALLPWVSEPSEGRDAFCRSLMDLFGLMGLPLRRRLNWEIMMWEALHACRNQMPLWWECLGAVGLSEDWSSWARTHRLEEAPRRRGAYGEDTSETAREVDRDLCSHSERQVCFERCRSRQQPQVFPQSHVRIRSVREFSYEKTYWWPSHNQLLYSDFIDINLNRNIQHPFAEQSWILIYHDRKFWSLQWLNWQH